jgi:fructosamine-3-kinase
VLSGTDGPQVAAAFGLVPLDTGDGPPVAPALTGPVARGQVGQVWRLDTAAGPYAVKEWFASPDPAVVALDADFAEAARRHGVHTPCTVRTADGSASATVRCGDGSTTTVRVLEWVDLQPSTRRLDPVAVGATVAALHRAAPPAIGPSDPVEGWFASGIGERSWSALLERVARAGAPFASVLAALVDELVAVESVVEPHERPITCHRDLWADNVRATSEGRLCVIDLESLGPADPSQELAMVVFEFGDDDRTRARAIHTAYVDAGGPGRVTRRGHFTMLVAEQAHLAQLACSRWVGAHDPDERDRLARWFLEIADDPVTLARIDRALLAVT